MTTERNYFVPETDLSLLERSVATMHEGLTSSPAYQRPDIHVACEEAKRILSDVRWGYGPHESVERVTP